MKNLLSVSVLLLLSAVSTVGSGAFAMGKPLKCELTLSSSALEDLFRKYVPQGSNGRAPAAAIYQVGESGEVSATLFQSNSDKSQAVASTQKIVTAWLAAKYGDLSKKVVFTSLDLEYDLEGIRAAYPGSQKQIEVGDTVSVGELVYTLLHQSSNGAAQAISRAVSGDTRSFVKLMNQEVPELLDHSGVDTYFQNPHGLTDSDSHYQFGEPGKTQHSTADNMARMIGKIMSAPVFLSAMRRIGYATAADGELIKLGHTHAAGKTIVARVSLPQSCSHLGVSMAFFGSEDDLQFPRYSELMQEIKSEIDHNTH